MSFAATISNYKTVSIVGMEKNTGKTECFNYIISNIADKQIQLAITSIGYDGETIDNVTGTAKPEIHLCANTLFVTAEACYAKRHINAEILDIGSRPTSLGRLVTARSLGPGKVMLAGPSETLWLREVINRLQALGATTTLVDGSISRLSHGSPLVADGIVLTTGASVSNSLPQLVKQTRYIHQLIHLPQVTLPEQLCNKLLTLNDGLYFINEMQHLEELKRSSSFLLDTSDYLPEITGTLFIPGAITSRLLDYLRLQRRNRPVRLLIKDFTRIFADRKSLYAFVDAGHEVLVLLNTQLIAVCVNPVAPNGFRFNSKELCDAVADALGRPVYDIKSTGYAVS